MAKLFVKEYPWFYMPASGHKILVVVPLEVYQVDGQSPGPKIKKCGVQ